ncbi:VOC family protein [Halosegnis marinus]|uniref:VOC family protein n=1 Tax=Halosegnis marinus TaxID=3034023 RepID=A0ABD5ZMF9_9EURY|nr:VOC family protein [Halosegnis sp. DT85]
MRPTVRGIHHVTGIVRDAGANVGFYADTLGLRFLKRTVDLEDRFSYHFHYGDATGSAGSVLTSFPFPDEADGRVGRPQIADASLAVPAGSLGYWRDRLADAGAEVGAVEERFAERALPVRDPDGTRLELVTARAHAEPWDGGDVPAEHGIRGVAGVSLLSASPFVTASLLETFGFERGGQEGDRVRYETGRGVVDLLDREAPFGREGAGTIHHVAFGVESDEALHEWRDVLADREDARVSYVKDREFYRSLYVRGAGGILFELATEPTDLTAGDPAPGEHLYLPDRFEEDRDLIESQLPPL